MKFEEYFKFNFRGYNCYDAEDDTLSSFAIKLGNRCDSLGDFFDTELPHYLFQNENDAKVAVEMVEDILFAIDRFNERVAKNLAISLAGKVENIRVKIEEAQADTLMDIELADDLKATRNLPLSFSPITLHRPDAADTEECK